MWKLTLTLLIAHTAYANDIDLNILDKSLVKDHSLSDFTKYYGVHKRRYKNIYHFEKDRINTIVYVNERKVVYKAELQFYKSTISFTSLAKKLNKFTKLKNTAHSSGRFLTYKDKNETIRFHNNSNLSLDSYEVSWEK